MSHGRDYSEQRFSPLEGITTENVDQLDLARSFEFPTARGMEATSLIHNGIIYISTGWSHVYAIDAQNCSFYRGISARGHDINTDLRYMSEQTHSDVVAIVFGGKFAYNRMAGFYKTLNLDDVAAVHAYLDQQQRLAHMREMSAWQKIKYWCITWLN